MAQTPREIVTRALNFECPERVPRDIWGPPWAKMTYPDAVERLSNRFPSDLQDASDIYRPSSRKRGNAHLVGEYIDEWGCIFENLQDGIIGEVKTPIIEDVNDLSALQAPFEILPDNMEKARDSVNRQAAASDKFFGGNMPPRLWERMQFLRGTVESMMDTCDPDTCKPLLKNLQDFYLRDLEFWVKTDVDYIFFMDDWGSQQNLLVSPAAWRELFKPLYKEYCDLAHAHGKYVFMHSDGNIQEIYPDLIEIGVDAVNSQLFCMDMDLLRDNAKGKITFWGEIDRQHILISKNLDDGRKAVQQVVDKLYSPEGGIIAQFEFGPGANPDMPEVLFEEWERLTGTS